MLSDIRTLGSSQCRRTATVAAQGRKGFHLMRQLYIQEPWANLGYESQAQILNDLTIRIQVLENRIRQLEETVSDRIVDTEPVGVGS